MKQQNIFAGICVLLLLGCLPGGALAQQGPSFLETEAGISASTDLSPDPAAAPVDLAAAKDKFRTIEQQTSDYIIGSVGIDNYGNTEDPHVYLHKDGEIIAYYSQVEPVGKIIDWRNDLTGSLEHSKLIFALDKVGNAALGRQDFHAAAATYYDFRFPDATGIKVLVDSYSSTPMYYELPTGMTVHDASFSHYSRVGSGSTTVKITEPGDSCSFICGTYRLGISYGDSTINNCYNYTTEALTINGCFQNDIRYRVDHPYGDIAIVLLYSQP